MELMVNSDNIVIKTNQKGEVKERIKQKLEELFNLVKGDFEEDLMRIESSIDEGIEKFAKAEVEKVSKLSRERESKRRSSVLRGMSLKSNTKESKLVKLVGNVENNNGGMFFHPRELINETLLVTGGRDGVIKIWEQREGNYTMINQYNTEIEWITGIKYDNTSNLIYTSTYTEYILVFNYDLEKNVTSLKEKFLTDLTLIYGFDVVNFHQLEGEGMTMLICGGFTFSAETVYIYTYQNSEKIEFKFHQALKPKDKNQKNYAKSIKFCEKLNLVVIGLINGIIEVYKMDIQTYLFEIAYRIDFETSDWVYQIQILNNFTNFNSDLEVIRETQSEYTINTGSNTAISSPEITYRMKSAHILASNANTLYLLELTDHSFNIIKQKEFIASIHDFFHVPNPELIFLKIKTGLILLYSMTKNEILDEIDETKKKGLYDHCLIASKTNRLLYSCRDHDILIYKY